MSEDLLNILTAIETYHIANIKAIYNTPSLFIIPYVINHSDIAKLTPNDLALSDILPVHIDVISMIKLGGNLPTKTIKAPISCAFYYWNNCGPRIQNSILERVSALYDKSGYADLISGSNDVSVKWQALNRIMGNMNNEALESLPTSPVNLIVTSAASHAEIKERYAIPNDVIYFKLDYIVGDIDAAILETFPTDYNIGHLVYSTVQGGSSTPNGAYIKSVSAPPTHSPYGAHEQTVWIVYIPSANMGAIYKIVDSSV